MAYVPEPVLTRDHRCRPPVGRGQSRGHLADGVRPAAAGVVRGEGPRTACGDRLQRHGVRGGHVPYMDEVAALAAVLEDPGGLPAGQGRTEEGGDTRVRGVAWHPGPVHVVVAQRHRAAARRAGPGRGQVFLGEFGRGVHIARVGRRVLRDQPGLQLGTAVRTARLEAAPRQVGLRARAGPDRAMTGTRVAALPVDHHRSGEHQTPDPCRRHGGQQHGRSQVVASHIRGGVREVLPQADHRRLVTHHVDAPQRTVHGLAVTHVGDDRPPVGADAGAQGRGVAVRRGEQGIEHHRLVPGRHEGPDDLRPDEPGSAGNQYTHGPHVRARGHEPCASTTACHGTVRVRRSAVR